MRRIGSLLLIVSVVLLAFGSWTLPFHHAAGQPVGVQAVPVLTGLNNPVALKLAPDGRIFFTEKDTGKIRIISNNGTLLPVPFATISPIFTDGEAGLLGIALDPSFNSNGYVYVYYTYRDSSSYTHGHIVRYTAVGDRGTAPLSIFDAVSSVSGSIYHNGGYIKFGPDGELYAQVGEFHQGSQAQNQSATDGKILRMNPDGSVPSDNPFPNSLVWALGFRNGFGFDWDQYSGRMIATMAGPSSDDKILIVVKGGNYGWPTCVGICNDPRFINPTVDINPIVTPTGIATVQENEYYFGEYNTGNLVDLKLSSAGAVVSMNTVLNQPGGIIAVEYISDNRLLYSTPDAIYTYNPFTTSLPLPMFNAIPWIFVAVAAIFGIIVYLIARDRFRKRTSEQMARETGLSQFFAKKNSFF